MSDRSPIHVESAGLSLSKQGFVILSVPKNGRPSCICFKDLAQLGQAIAGGQVKVRRWAVSLPNKLCICKKVTLPTPHLEEAVKMVEFELPGIVPIPLSELTYGCSLAQQREGSVTLWVYVAKLSKLYQHLEPLQEVGIHPSTITVDSLAFFHWIAHFAQGHADNALLFTEDKNGGVFLDAYAGGLLQIDTWEPPKLQTPGRIASFLQHAIQTRRQKDDLASLPTCVYTATEEHTEGVETAIENTLNQLEPIQRIPITLPDPMEWCSPWNGQFGTREELANACTISVGTMKQAQEGDCSYQNLAPAQLLAAQRRRIRQQQALQLSCLIVAVLLLGWGTLWAMNQRLERRIVLLQETMAPYAQIADSIEAKRLVVSAVNRQQLSRVQLLDVLHDIYAFMPESVYLTQMTYESRHGKTSVDIKGYSTKAETTLDIPSHMEKAPLLNRVQLGHIGGEETQQDGSQCAPFTLHGEIK